MLFLFQGTDMWHAQGQFVQMFAILFLCLSFIFPKDIRVKNKSMGFLLGALGLSALYYQYIALSQGTYAIYPAIIFINIICGVIIYQFVVQTLNRDMLSTILNWLKWSVMVMIIISIFQKFGFTQFLEQIKTKEAMYTTRYAMTGFIGHPTHLAGYLGMCLPLFFGRKLINYLLVTLIWIMLLLYTNFSINVSISGIAVGIASCGYYLWKVNKKLFMYFLICLTLLIPVVLKVVPKSVLSSSGRMTRWHKYIEESRDTFWLGKGLGYINLIGAKDPDKFKHAHNEYIQFYLEAGMLTLLAILSCIVNYFRVRIVESRDTIKIRAMFFGFCVSCLFTFPAHLWVTATMGILFYSAVYAVRNKEIIDGNFS